MLLFPLKSHYYYDFYKDGIWKKFLDDPEKKMVVEYEKTLKNNFGMKLNFKKTKIFLFS